MSREDIEHELGRPVPVRMGGQVRSPGQLPSHYAPRAQVVLVRPDELAARARLLHDQGLRVGVITTEGIVAPTADTVVISGSDVELARLLYAALREFDLRGCSVVLDQRHLHMVRACRSPRRSHIAGALSGEELSTAQSHRDSLQRNPFPPCSWLRGSE